MSPTRAGAMLRRLRAVAGILAGLSIAVSWGGPVHAEDLQWQGVERIVAVGDLHGDYAQFRQVLHDAGLIDGRGKWAGGKAHLVQTGDITDRGPDSARIIDHLERLKKEARRKGGRVHTLIGNHEAMNSYGDLRYVHEGEFAAFAGPRSEAIRERQIDHMLKQFEQQRPEEFAQLDVDEYRAELRGKFPLGWVEHRLAWMPEGDYGRWLLDNPVAVKINDTLFVHGGFSGKYCAMDLAEMTGRAHDELRNFDAGNPGMIEDPMGPLWYRGLAQGDEKALSPVVDGVLERYGARRIVIGHTPTGGVVWPRFEGRVVANDTGIAVHYGGHDAFLEIRGDSAWAHYGDRRLALPATADGRESYLREVMALRPDNEHLQARLERLLAPPAPEITAPTADRSPGATPEGEAAEEREDVPQTGDDQPVTAGICQ